MVTITMIVMVLVVELVSLRYRSISMTMHYNYVPEKLPVFVVMFVGLFVYVQEL